jgi:bifunctional polynucleotide phosphatase/kinase
MPGMWEEFVHNWNGGLEVDFERSFYVGDAAGRKSDHSGFLGVLVLCFHSC